MLSILDMNLKQLIKCLLPFPLVLGLNGTAVGQTQALAQRLATTTGLSCTFSVLATGAWTNGKPRAKVTPAKLVVTYVNVDVDEGTASTEGQLAGASFIVVRYSRGYLHLMQMQSTGPLYTTTVLAKETKDGRLMAVHTRHEYTDVIVPGFTSSPEMYMGDCALGT